MFSALTPVADILGGVQFMEARGRIHSIVIIPRTTRDSAEGTTLRPSIYGASSKYRLNRLDRVCLIRSAIISLPVGGNITNL